MSRRPVVDLSPLSVDEQAWLEGLAERRDAWTGTQDEWIDYHLTLEERLELTRIYTLLA